MTIPGSRGYHTVSTKSRSRLAAGFDWREPGCSQCVLDNEQHLTNSNRGKERCALTSKRNPRETFREGTGHGGRWTHAHHFFCHGSCRGCYRNHCQDVRKPPYLGVKSNYPYQVKDVKSNVISIENSFCVARSNHHLSFHRRLHTHWRHWSIKIHPLETSKTLVDIFFPKKSLRLFKHSDLAFAVSRYENPDDMLWFWLQSVCHHYCFSCCLG